MASQTGVTPMTTSERWFVIVACTASSILGAASTRLLDRPVSAQDTTVRAQRFELVNESGRVMAVLGNLGYQGITSPLVGLAFYATEEAKPLISLGLGPEGDAAWSAWYTDLTTEKNQFRTKQGPRTALFFRDHLSLTARGRSAGVDLFPEMFRIHDENGARVTAHVVKGKGEVKVE
jgi:hypothetical protein